MPHQGLHLIVDVYQGDPNILCSLEAIHNLLIDLATITNMKAITRPYVFPYDGGGIASEAGITGFLIIAESHISVHTYAIKRTAFLDVFSCRRFNEDLAVTLIRERLSSPDLRVTKVARGSQYL